MYTETITVRSHYITTQKAKIKNIDNASLKAYTQTIPSC